MKDQSLELRLRKLEIAESSSLICSVVSDWIDRLLTTENTAVMRTAKGMETYVRAFVLIDNVFEK